MMKKVLCIFSCVLLCVALLCGCAGDPQGTKSTEPSTQTVPAEALNAIAAPADPGNDLMDYDPGRELYILCHNIYVDFYTSGTINQGVNFYIISRKPLDTESVTVELPIQNEYSFEILDCGDTRITEAMAEQGTSVLTDARFPYYLYQVYQNIDWQELAALNSGDKGAFAEEQRKYSAAFYTLTEADIPEFHVYSCAIYFNPSSIFADESFEEMKITIEGTTYTEAFGSVSLHNYPIPLEYPDDGSASANGTLFISRLYDDGIGAISSLYVFTAEQDMTITGISIQDKTIKMLDANVAITTQNGFSLEYQWDMSQPIDLSAGDQMSLSLTYQDERFTGLEGTSRINAALNYEAEDGFACKCVEMTLYRSLNYHEWYAVIFNGIDMKPYYMNYYYPVYAAWVEEYRGQG